MSDQKPVWFLDVDGVLNAISMTPPDTWPTWKREWCVAQNDKRYSIHYSPEMIQRIIDIANSGACEIRWLTTWEHAAVQNLAPMLGLPEFVVAGRAIDHVDHDWWKFPCVMAFVETHPDVPVIWADDDLRYYRPALELAQERGKTGHMLAIAPRSYLGLTPNHLDHVDAFLEAS